MIRAGIAAIPGGRRACIQDNSWQQPRGDFAAQVAEVLAVSAERDRMSAALAGAEARGYRLGAAYGYALGVADRLEATAVRQREIAGIVRHLAEQPDAEALERCRWSVRGEPRTRAEFAAPHPGDRGPFSAAQLAEIAAAWEAGTR